VPVVARGAGTGLSGGAMPHAMGVTLSLAKFNQILSDRPRQPHGGGAGRRAQPGHQRGRAHPMACITRPTRRSQIACTIGGNVAENSGGVHCLKYGLTVHNVLQGARLHHRGRAHGVRRLGRAGHAGPGPAESLVIGSEGMLAVTTEVTVQAGAQAAAGALHHGQLRRRAQGRRRGGRR
jgi:glycolate oxidase